jgi:hypothetical protein
VTVRCRGRGLHSRLEPVLVDEVDDDRAVEVVVDPALTPKAFRDARAQLPRVELRPMCRPEIWGFFVCFGSSASLGQARGFSGALARVNNRTLIRESSRMNLRQSNSPICRSFVMGRAGIEPATLGLRVDANASRELADAA